MKIIINWDDMHEEDWWEFGFQSAANIFVYAMSVHFLNFVITVEEFLIN